MTLRLYDTMRREKVEFKPFNKERVTMYVCGPTVYDLAHVGNARPVVVFDVLYRLLRRIYGEKKVVYARNVTDIDDKIIDAARERGEDIAALTARTEKAFHDDMAALGALPPDVEPHATAHIAEMIALIETLIASGHAYAAEGHVLFQVSKMKDYGRLSRHSRDELIAGARVEVAPYKKDPADFVLWKPSTPEQPGWPGPWGRGRPGWHLECSAMSEKHLGLPIDIHGGGQDLIFPHHENEIAQSVCAHGGAAFVRHWLHNGYVTVGGEKMSKSTGNFKTVRDLMTDVGQGRNGGEIIRFALLSAHYRHPLDWNDGLVRSARNRLGRYYGVLFGFRNLEADTNAELPGQLMEFLMDDLNTPGAFSELDKLVTLAIDAADDHQKSKIKSQLLAAGKLLGIVQADPEAWQFERLRLWASKQTGAEVSDWQKADEIAKAMMAKTVQSLIDQRAAARRARDFKEADRVRKLLEAEGIELKDLPDGTTEWSIV